MILDVDTGTDDAMALMLALRSPELEVAAVTCVSGNVGVDLVVQNTLKALDAGGAPPDLPVARGFAEPLVEPVVHCPEIHGQDGLGDLVPRVPASTRELRPEHATELLNGTLRRAEDAVTVFALGPLTNIAVAIRLCPEVWLSKVEQLIWMGGAVACGGNCSAWTEANSKYDPEAARIVLRSGVPILIYPWDVYEKLIYTRVELLQLGIPHPSSARPDDGERPDRDSASALAGRILHREMDHFDMTWANIGDAGAVAAALERQAVTTRRLHVDVELTGSRTRGMTVCDLRGPTFPPDEPKEPENADVVVGVDVEVLKGLFTQRVLRARNDGHVQS